MDYRAQRKRLVDWLRLQMIGPASRGETLQGVAPLDRFPCGKLYPVIDGQEGLDAAAEDDEMEDISPLGDEVELSGVVEQTVRPRRYVAPSAVGFSFFARGNDLKFHVRCSAVRYARINERNEAGRFSAMEFERIPLGGDEEAITFANANRVDVLRDSEAGYLAGLDVQWRSFADGWIVTVSLFNKQTWMENDEWDERANRTLFEVNLDCFIDGGVVGDYPRVQYGLLNEEEQEIELQYKHRKIYAVGHGAAVDWVEKMGKVVQISSDFMPLVEVPQVTADVADDNTSILQMARLANFHCAVADTVEDLERFVEGYAAWVGQAQSETSSLEPHEIDAGKRITDRMEIALKRMRGGIRLIEKDSTVALAFSLANQSMLMQMQQGDEVKGERKANERYAWRPFQLAFLLTVMESSINDEDEFRDIVDLIWFPTGGGKTEAYLALIAFLIVWRRLTHRTTGGGTVVVMRYTLRLLTSQQYLRAAKLICALDLIRQQTLDLGEEPISIGMWVGAPSSPNSFRAAYKQVDKISTGNQDAARGLVLDACPWCGQAFGGIENYLATPDTFKFLCRNGSCPFGSSLSGVIPCNVVDEALYQEPPTLLIATIDKFARLAWEERAEVFFGGTQMRPPELIIQDELHLIAGALGSVAGVYEAAIYTVLQQRGCFPKYVASTATIRMAEQQVRRIYGAELALFPPPGLNCDDSYFAKTVDLSVRPGRLYVGYFAPALDQQHCMAPLSAALLAAPEAVFGPDTEERDALLEAWWSQVVYHGSLKGVGNSHNAFNIDVRGIFGRFIDEADLGDNKVTRALPHLAQLTSVSSAEQNARTFTQLESVRGKEECLDAVLATNMVSVGLDVPRLALMVINGQPLTTAEYIQASSRVGRSVVPGIVCMNYYRNSARNVSHFENFRPYHESFYRFVEPTSVTPFTYQSRLRALHAALVIAIRYSCRSLLANNRAASFDPENAQVKKVIQDLKRRCSMADPGREDDISSHIDRLVDEWQAEIRSCALQKRQLSFQANDKEKNNERLLYNHTDKIKGLWPTLQSMRNVEQTALLKSL
ncbi:MAG: helicase-related protein [Pseudomonadota bacterium]